MYNLEKSKVWNSALSDLYLINGWFVINYLPEFALENSNASSYSFQLDR